MLPLWLLLSSCNVHEWVEPEPTVPYLVHLQFNTDFPILEHNLNTRDPEGLDLITRHTVLEKGLMRYHFRAFPLENNDIQSSSFFSGYTEEWTVEGNYNRDIILNLSPGRYRLMVWADVRTSRDESNYYNMDDFTEIKLMRHEPNNDYRDCFRGSADITVTQSIELTEVESVTIEMERPVAKFEFLTNDLAEFINREIDTHTKARQDGDSSNDKDARSQSSLRDTESLPDINDYKLNFNYVGFMPTAYSMFDDKPSDSEVNHSFQSKLTKLNDNEASLGFDYVFVNHNQTTVSLQVAIYDKENNLISLSDAIDVPIKRSNHTVITGSFLTMDADGDVGIDPGYDGDFNVNL